MTTRNIYGFTLRLLVLIAVTFGVKKAVAADSPPAIVHILAIDPCAGETGGDTATFAVFRNGPTNAALTVQYALAGTAANGVDYAALSGAVTIPPGRHAARITVTPIDDTLVEGTEVVAIFLDQPAVWPPPYIVCWPSFAVGHIEDNDFPPTNRPPHVRLASPPDGSVFLAPVDLLLVAHATDSDGRVVSVEFFDGTTSLGVVTNRPRVIQPIALDDDGPDLAAELDPLNFPDLDDARDPTVLPPNVFRLKWEDFPPGAHTLTAVATDNQGASTRSEAAHIRVLDPPLQPIVNVYARDPEATEPDPTANRLDTAMFVVHRSGPTNIPLTVFYRLGGSAANGIDYAELPHSVTIDAGQRRAPIVVEPLDDSLVEGDESVHIHIVPPICIAIFPPPPDCYRVGRHDSARAVIHDNDRPNRPPLVRLVRPEDGSVFIAPADIGLAAQARDPDGRVVMVEFFEGTNSLGIVTNRNTVADSRTPLFGLKWPSVPPGHYVLHAVATDNDGDSARSQPVEIKVVGRTDPPVVNIEATDDSAAEVVPPGTPNTATFTVSRTGPTDRALLVRYELGGDARNGADYTELSGRVLIPAGAASAPVVVSPIDDRLVEGPETVKIALLEAICLADTANFNSCYRIGPNDNAGAVIRDNDLAPTNQPPKIEIVRPEDGDIFAAPADIVIYSAAKDTDGFVRTVEFFANDHSLGVVSNSLSNVSPVDPAAHPEQFFRLAWDNVAAGGYALTAKATDNRGAMTLSGPVHIRVIERIEPPVVTIEAVDPHASEGDLVLSPVAVHPLGAGVIGVDSIRELPDTATFVVKRDRGTNIDLIVYYSVSGTAANGTDYARLSGRVTIPRGSHRAAIVVVPFRNNLVEGTETVIVALDPIACARVIPPPPECYVVGHPGRDIAYIRDGAQNLSPRVAIVRPETGDLFREGADIPIVVQTLDRDGYVPRVEFFVDGRSIGVQEVVFIVEPPPGQVQRWTMVWSNAPAGPHTLTALATDNDGAKTLSRPVDIRVVDTDPIPVVNIVAVDAFAREGDPPNTATFRIRRSGRTNDPLTVFLSYRGTASNGVDYAELPTSVTIPPGRRGTRLIVTPIDDRRPERTETVIARLEDSHHYDLGRRRRAGAIIVDNDAPRPGCSLLDDGNFHFRADALPGQCYRLEGSDNLRDWETLVDCLLGEDAAHFVDAERSDLPRRFIRLVRLSEEEFFDEE